MSIARVEIAVTLAIGSLFARYAMQEAQPVPQPSRIVSEEPGTQNAALPQPEYDMGAIMRGLRTAEDVQDFLQALPATKKRTNFWKFFWTYHRSPEELQEAEWQGSCNNFARFSSTWAYIHGGTPYLVNLCPRGMVAKVRNDWHQLTVCEMLDGRCVIFDNRKVEIVASLSAYLAREYPDKEIASFIGGIIRWRKPGESLLARYIGHGSAENVEEKDIEAADLPLRGQPSRPTGRLV